MALSYLAAAGGGALPDRAAVRALIERVGQADAATVLKVRENRALSPLTSGAGRLFEAAAALAGLCDRNTLRGRGGDAARGGSRRTARGAVRLRDDRRWPAANRLLAARSSRSSTTWSAARPPGFVAARFHATVAAAVVEQVGRLHRATGLRDVALSGGVFQNRLLLGAVTRGVEALGLKVHTNTRVPANDGGISLGQAYLLRQRTDGARIITRAATPPTSLARRSCTFSARPAPGEDRDVTRYRLATIAEANGPE